MENKITTFSNEEFGNVRTMIRGLPEKMLHWHYDIRTLKKQFGIM